MTEPVAQLADGSVPATPANLFRRLDELEIIHQTFEHAPVFTVEEAKSLRGKLDGAHTKNLFLYNKKKQMWLVVSLEDRLIDLKALAAHVGAGCFSFCSADRLMQYLGVIPGAVAPFTVINDKQNVVRVLLDLGILQFERVNFHPLDNSMTTTLSADDLVKFLRAEGHAPEVTDLGSVEHER